MATLKHIASKNSDYTAIEAYLVYQHDAFTGKQLLDDHGRPMLRESYLLDTLECGDSSFATACLLANRKYGKNTQHGDIKSHQYIISFDPRDAADNGLTMEKAQALGLKFCEENFPGHPAIVCTHPDGHNRSGNIHVHIVIGSIRTREVERKPYMQKPRDWLEGTKHSSTAQTMRHLRVEVMELCEGAGLYQIDLLNGSKERVSEAEYWARRRGQLKLDRENAALTAAGQPPRQKKFETVKDTLRKQISSVLYRATSFEDFSDRLMQQYGITVKESRGQLSYLPSGRTKFIRAKKLGDKFDKAAVLATLQANAERKPKAQFKQDTIGKLIDIQSRMTEGKGIGYKRWLTKHNLKVILGFQGVEVGQLLEALLFQGLDCGLIENQGAFMLTSELLFVSSPLILLQQRVQFLTGGDILYQHGHFCKPALCCFQCGGSFGAGGGDLGHSAFQIRVAFDFMLRQKVQRPGSLFQIVDFCPLLIPCGLLGLDAVLQINPQRNFMVFFGLPFHGPSFNALGNSFLGIGFSQCFAAGEPFLSGRTERNILATLYLVALLLQEPQKIVKILGLRNGCIYGGFQLRLPTRALAVRVPLGIALAPCLGRALPRTGHVPCTAGR